MMDMLFLFLGGLLIFIVAKCFEYKAYWEDTYRTHTRRPNYASDGFIVLLLIIFAVLCVLAM